MELPAELHIGHTAYKGTVWDVSQAGSLFLPEARVEAKAGMHGRLRIGTDGHLQPQVNIVRVADVQHSNIPAVRGVGVEFLHLTHGERQALEHLLAGSK